MCMGRLLCLEIKWLGLAICDVHYESKDKDTGEVTEHIYKNAKSASKRLINYMQDGMHDVVVCNHDSIHLIKTTEEDTDDESDYDD